MLNSENELEDYMTMAIEGEEDEEEGRKKNNEDVKSREDKLRRALDSSILTTESKGLRIMQKMGFDVNDSKGLGKHRSGEAEPVRIEIKRGRFGIGAEKLTAQDRPADELKKIEQGFIKNRAQTDNESYWRNALRSIQNIAMELEEYDLYELYENWRDGNLLYRDVVRKYHEQTCSTVEEHEVYDEEDLELQDLLELEVTVQFEKVNIYLRNTYQYCFWCGCHFGEEYSHTCPGPTEADHEKASSDKETDDDEYDY